MSTNWIIRRYNNSASRTQLAIKNIVGSIFLKFASIATSLLIVPLTISYVNPTQYGLWMTISSVVGWITFFDLGLANGFRNKFAEAKANGDIHLARQYVSTTYFLITLIVAVAFGVIVLLNSQISWSRILNVNSLYDKELSVIFVVLAGFFCVNMIAGIFGKLLAADQRPALAALFSGLGQVLSLGAIYILTKVSNGSLLNLAIYFAGVPCITMTIASVVMFLCSKYKQYCPSVKYIKLHLVKDIMGVGLKFFAIYLCLIVVFQLMNIVLSREIGPIAVTQYNIANKYFSVVYMFSVIVVSPFWSAFTDAYTKGDLHWMNNVLKKLEVGIILSIVVSLLMFVISPFVYKIWIGDNVSISWQLSFSVMLYILSQVGGCVYMNLINGVGTIKIQFIIYLIFAIISYPLMTILCREYGIIGITIMPTLVYLIQTIAGRVQIKKIINQTATGIWLK